MNVLEMARQKARDDFFRQVDDCLDGVLYLKKECENGWSFEMYRSGYDDKLDPKNVAVFCMADPPYDPMRVAQEYIDEAYEDYAWQTQNDICAEVMKKIELPDNTLCDWAEELEEHIREVTWGLTPEDEYLDDTICVNIMLDCGDARNEYRANDIYPGSYGEPGEPIAETSSIRWLAEQQGYTVEQLRSYLDGDHDTANPKGFLQTLYCELINSYGYKIVTFLARMKIRDVLELNQALTEGSWFRLRISKDTVTGLFDPFNGAGGPFEVELDKDVIVPMERVRSILPDVKDAVGRWPIEEVYGMVRSEWKEDVVEVLPAPTEEETK